MKSLSQQLEIPDEMYRRMKFLIRHNKKYSGMQIGTRPDDGPIVRNCYGTAAYVLGLEKQVRDLWIAAGNKLNDNSSENGEYIFHKEDKFPDYVGPEAMMLLLKKMKKTIKLPGAITTYAYDDERDKLDSGFMLRHAGVYLFTDNGSDIMFEQNGRGGKWQYICNDTRICGIGKEKSLSRRTLKIAYFMPQ